MVELMEMRDAYRAGFEAVVERAGDGWEWYRSAREGAMERFAAVGFPDRKEEAWRFTDVRPIARTQFAVVEPAEAAEVAVGEGVLRCFGFAGLAGPRLVFVDGRFRADLSDIGELPAGVRVMSLAEAVEASPEAVREHLGRGAAAGDDADAFALLNAALVEDGLFVDVGRGVRAAEPIHALFLSSGGDRPAMTHPRNVIVAEESAEATVIEQYGSLSNGVYLSNAATELSVAANANLHHYVLERESERAYAVATLHARQERDSRLESHTILLGGAIVRNNVHAELLGEGCHSLINGLYLPRGEQHMDNHMKVVHAAPHCDSRQFYKGVLNDRASAVFSGRILVHPEGQQTDAKQSNSNLLLSGDAHVDAQPQLEIYADDVKCTHGATMGQIDESALFYLRSRGIGEDAARGLLIYAFAHESLDRIRVEAVRRALDRLLMERLPESGVLEGLFGRDADVNEP